MFNDSTLRQEIEKVFADHVMRDVACSADAATMIIVSKHYDDDFVRGADFHAHCAWHTTRKAVGQFLVKTMKSEDGELVQMTLPGWEFVQRAYVVRRGGDDVAVPTYTLSYEELQYLSLKLTKEGDAKHAHGKELLQLCDQQYPQGDTA